jgi:hypothetical protein
MKKNKIEEAYKIAGEQYPNLSMEVVKDLVQIGIQMSQSEEVLFEDGSVIRIE